MPYNKGSVKEVSMDYRQQLVNYWVARQCDFMRLSRPYDIMIDRVVSSVELLNDDEVLELLSEV